MSKALEGLRILDMTHVQLGPSATQILAWLGADVIKVELPGRGDITRTQLRDVPDVDSLYFTMLNCNKRSITLNTKTDRGKEIFRKLIAVSDVLVENFAPGALDRQGFTWETIRAINPRIIYASGKGFGTGPYIDCKAYETVAQAMGGSMSTTGWADGAPTSTGAQIGDSGTGIHLVAALLAAVIQREKTGRGQRVEVAMQDCVMNLCRVKMRDQQRLQHGPLKEYPTKEFGDTVPRSGNASGGGQPGNALKCKGGGQNDYIYVIIQPPGWEPLMNLVGRQELIADSAYATPEARLSHLDECFGIIEEWTQKHDKLDVMKTLNKLNVPCGPIMSLKELMEDSSLVSRGMVVDVEHPQRGTFRTVGCPLQLSDSPVEVKTSPGLGEHTDEILEKVVGYGGAEIAKAREEGAI
ncbi:MAG TPA: formyl-CoA transferase [Acidobacteria bacterium]|jgi:formyl-CoA transferase|nr:formyl-CoA transferase [Acidobacteriota bacterium]|tara:strand:- start:299 stop:1531 length:1233 start_codon:yes stop_codon:yes gene_type:complete